MRVAMQGHWRVLVVVWLLLCTFAARPVLAQELGGDGAAPACVLCVGAKRVDCPTCLGKGHGPQVCEACWGEGRHRCESRIDPKASAAELSLFGSFGHKGTEIQCSNDLCRSGKVTFDDGKSYQCRVCGGRGTLKCADCRDAALPCAICKGRKTVDGPCSDCAGTGKLTCVVCADAEAKCGQCDGEGSLPCSRCVHAGRVVQPCLPCGGRGQSNCIRCDGIGKVACVACAGTSRARSQYSDGTTAASTKCAACSEKGTIACDVCKKGVEQCAACMGVGTVLDVCRACNGTTRIPCRASGPWGFRAGELEAGMLAKKGLKAEAATLLDAALVLARASVRSAEEALEKLAAAGAPVAKAPKAPEDMTKPGALADYLKLLRESVQQRMAAMAKLMQARDAARPFHEAVARMEAALAKLRPPVPAVPPGAPPK